MNELKRPQLPHARIIREGSADFCTECGSTRTKTGFLRMFGNLKCDNKHCITNEEHKEPIKRKELGKTPFGMLMVINEGENTCEECSYSGTSCDKLPCSWCSDYLGDNMYYNNEEK